MKRIRLMRTEQGSALIISLLMLVVLTLLAVSAINLSTLGLRAVNSMQTRSEALSAAQNAIEQIASSNFAASIGSVPLSYNIAVDAGKSYAVTVTTPCIKAMQTIKNSALKLTDPEDVKCYDSSTNPWSACANTVWQVTASVSDGFFGTSVQLTQGIALRMDNASAFAYSTSTSPVYICS